MLTWPRLSLLRDQQLMYEIEEGESQTHEASVHASGNTCVMQASYMKPGVSFSFYHDTYLHVSFRLAFQEMSRSSLAGEKMGKHRPRKSVGLQRNLETVGNGPRTQK